MPVLHRHRICLKNWKDDPFGLPGAAAGSDLRLLALPMFPRASAQALYGKVTSGSGVNQTFRYKTSDQLSTQLKPR